MAATWTGERRSAVRSEGRAAGAVTEISQILNGFEQRLRTVAGGAAVAAMAQVAVYHLPGARWASVALIRPGQVRTLVATAPLAQEAEALQHELDSGPSVARPWKTMCICPRTWPATADGRPSAPRPMTGSDSPVF